ncbi:MAG: M28 family peptidase [Planctomycetota bacterium]|nr:M28 family peptidase [Planctomycetota bacterium]
MLSSTRPSGFVRLFQCASAGALLAALAAGCAQGIPGTPIDGGKRTTPVVFRNPAEFDPDDSISAALEELGDEGKAFHLHVTTLANPYFEGRGPGTRGIERAAEYMEFYYETLGLTPAFTGVEETPDGSEILTANTSWRQGFTAPGRTLVEEAEFAWRAGSERGSAEFGKDFNPMGISGNGEAEGELVFAGYSIETGEGGSSSYGAHESLKGKVAMVLRFEPMDEKGESLWSDDDGWSSHALLSAKLERAAERGAVGVILVNPPGAADERADEIMTVQNSRLGGSMDVPVVMLSRDAADRLVRAGDPEGRSLMDLRRIADAGSAGTIALSNATVSMKAEITQERVPTDNVGAILQGRGELKDEFVVIGAHYDHLGYGGRGSRSPQHRGEIHAGADDNASGTAGVLVLAETLSRKYDALPADANARSILFLNFSAEEMGLLGARHYVSEPSIPLSQINLMINMDMIGRLDEALEINGVGTGKGLAQMLAPLIERSEMNVETERDRQVGMPLAVKTSESGFAPTDQTAFVQEGIPVLGFFTGLHEEYHTVFDVASTINHAGAVRVLDLVGEIAMAAATMDEKLEYVDLRPQTQAGGVRRARVRLGIAPGNYADTQVGVVVGEVYEGTTAAEGGVLKGDRIIRWGGEELPDVMAMMERLASHEPGDEVTIVVDRDGQEVELRLVMQPRGGAQ